MMESSSGTSTGSAGGVGNVLVARERVETHVFGTSREACRTVSRSVAERVREATAERPLVVGLGVDSALAAVYDEVVRLAAQDDALRAAFRHVHAAVLHEYHGLAPHMQDLQSAHVFLRHHLLDHVDIAPGALVPCLGRCP